ncbi:hypothetical protein [Aporhodopirellula aestuarii]|uniref:Uncharacterized protein n=1 Tax=Aporhodopirellula aestuarii TaxID=2950107 RepID=A0ABT0UAR7_9BACT|nr:hypothetical protein [Aporhodopirellula aestuarii]MCM2373995.1 hypothetical protein [Aporhodopirellula aestuarii]
MATYLKNPLLITVVFAIQILFPLIATAGRLDVLLDLARGARGTASRSAGEVVEHHPRSVSRCGEEVDEAIRVGDGTIVVADEIVGQQAEWVGKLYGRYGDDAHRIIANTNAMEIVTQYGDDVAVAVIKHGELAVGLVNRHGVQAADALTRVSSRNARRLDMLSREGVFSATEQSPLLWKQVIARGDEAADFIWRNKGALTTATVLAAFLTDPDPFIDGVEQLSAPIGETINDAVRLPLTFLAWISVIVIAVVVVRRCFRPKSSSVEHNLVTQDATCRRLAQADGPIRA